LLRKYIPIKLAAHFEAVNPITGIILHGFTVAATPHLLLIEVYIL